MVVERRGHTGSCELATLLVAVLLAAVGCTAEGGDAAAEAKVVPAAPEPPAPPAPVPVPEEVPKPRGVMIVTKGVAGEPAKFVAQAVTRKSVLREVVPYLEYLTAREGHSDGVIDLFDRTEEEAGVPLEPAKHFRFFLGSVQIQRGRGEFVENADYFKDDEDPTPNGVEIALALSITRWRKENGKTKMGTEHQAAVEFSEENSLDPIKTWRTFARVLDDSVSLGKEHFFERAQSGGTE